MRSQRARKVFLLGLDGVPPPLFRRFVDSGRLPRFARLLEQAESVSLIPTLPALTCPGWLSIASGAHPGSLGISNILLPEEGAAPDAIVNGFDRAMVRTELIWETMDRFGLPAIVLKYPGSWPPFSEGVVQVDGAGGYADLTCRFDVAHSQAYVARMGSADEAASTLFPSGYREHWRTHTGAAEGLCEVTPRVPRGWRNLPAGWKAKFEFVVPIPERDRRGRSILHGVAGRLQREQGLILSANKDGKGGVHLTAAAPWSDWIRFRTGDRRFACRFKLIELETNERRLWLYRTAGHRLSGFTRPEALADELDTALGPFCEWTGAYDLLNGLVDFETQLEIYRQHTEWLAKAVRHLTATRPWRGFFMQWHPVEYAHHLVGASLHPDHPMHPAARAAKDLDWLGDVYALADDLLGAVEEALDQETLLVVAGDHGHDLVHSVFFINHFLRRRGWLTTVWNNGRTVIDWSQSVAYGLFPGFVLLNRKSRWSGGIVADREAAALIGEITQELRGFRDPRTGHRPVKAVLDGNDLEFFGQWGPRTPDLFFCMDRGYEPATRIEAGRLGELELQVTTPYREVTSGHGSFFPASPSARTFALFRGPGFGPGSLGCRTMAAVDVAPTIAAYLGIPAPRGSDGKVWTPEVATELSEAAT